MILLRRVAIVSGMLVVSAGWGLARADSQFLVRCENFAVVDEGALTPRKDRHPTPATKPLDISLDLDEKTGWFDGMIINESKVGKLTVTPQRYWIEHTGTLGNEEVTEWLVLSRLEGIFGHYYRFKGQGTRELAQDGTCKRVDPKL